jgi:hypothetical protein
VEVVVRTGKVKVRSNELISTQRPTDCFTESSFAIRSKNLRFNKITDITQDESLSRSTSNIEQLDLNLQTFLFHKFSKLLSRRI